MKREEKNRTILRKREKEKMYNNIETKVYMTIYTYIRLKSLPNYHKFKLCKIGESEFLYFFRN